MSPRIGLHAGHEPELHQRLIELGVANLLERAEYVGHRGHAALTGSEPMAISSSSADTCISAGTSMS